MTVGSDTLTFTYDASGNPQTVTYGGTTYYYVTNLQGDVIAILNSSGTAVVTYTYDAWGNILNSDEVATTTLGTLNPLRYRGYVHDHETGLYYLQSRYYNPKVGRFINADSLVATGQGLLGNNMFAYCGNNPVMRVDPTGNAWRPPSLNTLQKAHKEVAYGYLPQNPSSYVNCYGEHINCYHYAFGLEGNSNPGDYSAELSKEPLETMYSNGKEFYTVDEIASFVLRDMEARGITVEIIDSPADAGPGEYVVALKTSDLPSPTLGIGDYHFAVMVDNYLWADKPGPAPSRCGKIIANLSVWENYYNSRTIYFAVKGEWP